MEVRLNSTTRMTEVNGVPARVWEGSTATGIPVIACITRIAVRDDQDCSQFERELKECVPPSADAVAAIPLRMLLD